MTGSSPRWAEAARSAGWRGSGETAVKLESWRLLTLITY